MKTLYLLRHSNALPSGAEFGDFDRPLSDKGQTRMMAMAQHFGESNIKPDVILCSSSLRTRETLDILLPLWAETPPEIIYTDAIYEASVDAIRNTLKDHAPGKDTVLVVGHNPGLQSLTMELAANRGDRAFQMVMADFSPATYSMLTAPEHIWDEMYCAKFTLLKVFSI